MRPAIPIFLVLAAVSPLAGTPGVETPRPALGLAVDLPPRASERAQEEAFEAVRSTGVSLFGLELSWSAAEPRPRDYRIAEITRRARLLRQSGATLHLDLPLVFGRKRDGPPDLAGVSFDDAKLSIRLGRLLEALLPALRDFATLSLGYEADAYFADKPEELKAYRRLFDGAVRFLRERVPHLAVGVTTMTPTESRAPEVAAALHQKSPVLFFIYAPFVHGRPFVHRAPDSLEHDWKRLLDSAGGRPIAFPEVSFSSAPENGSSLEAQAEFVRHLRGVLSRSDGRRLLFARYVPWRDAREAAIPPLDARASEEARRRRAFLASRGLQRPDGTLKPAWLEWVRAGR